MDHPAQSRPHALTRRPKPLALMLLTALAGLALVLLAGCGSSDPEHDSGNNSGSDSTAETAARSADSSSADGADGGTCSYPASSQSAAKKVEAPPQTPQTTGTVGATIATSAGDLAVTLDAERTLCTVNSFLSLAEQEYFADTDCHRLTTEGIFVLQCGDPTGTGSGGPGYSFADELDGSETYPAGTLAMANAGPDTNGSQFFVVYDDSPLPADYTVFGALDEAGTKTVADIAAEGTDSGAGDGAPKEKVSIESVTVAE